MRKTPNQYKSIIFAFVMSFNTALIVSGVITFINIPTLSLYFEKWTTSFLLAWPLVFVSILTIAPLINRFLDKIFEKK
jgi:hypothetical protein